MQGFGLSAEEKCQQATHNWHSNANNRHHLSAGGQNRQVDDAAAKASLPVLTKGAGHGVKGCGLHQDLFDKACRPD
jgi:hypothetical protein